MAADSDTPGLDIPRLRRYLDRERPGLFTGEINATLIEGGRSNLTYVLDGGADRWILRRPPLGHVLATAHDMGREYRVIKALGATDVPVPHAELRCTDADILGAPFYLMRWVSGTPLRSTSDAANLTPQQRADVAYELIDVLARLHAVEPASVGLGDFGHPEGFAERQVRRWRKQLDASRSREIAGIDALHDWLVAHVPTSTGAAIVHGDYRLDNVLVDGTPPHVTAVLDWEMATLGDPLTDLGLLQVYWRGAGANYDPITGSVTDLDGFPTWQEVAERYADKSGRDLTGLDWYSALGYFKLAVILEGIYYRFSHGETVGAGFDAIGPLVPGLVERGLAAAGNAQG